MSEKLFRAVMWEEFQAAGPVNTKLHLPSLRQVAGCSWRRLLEERIREWDTILQVDVTSSDKHE
jgi:hypothetical protein